MALPCVVISGRSLWPRRLALSLAACVYGCLLLCLSPAVSAIQVAPNSPCAGVCIDSSGDDPSDPNSSNTGIADMVCQDSDLSTTAVGKKWSACIGCLQNSTFTQGSESDQAWFFYNVRFNFNYCMFGYPNASDMVGSSPCQTSTACGPLADALRVGIPTLGNNTEFSYCGVDGNVMTSSQYDKCLACASSSGTNNLIANSLIALEAGCLQLPSQDQPVGLNASVTSNTVVQIVNLASATPSAKPSSKAHMATAPLVGIVIAVLLLAAVIAAAVFVFLRKRRVRQARSGRGGAVAPSGITSTGWGDGPNGGHTGGLKRQSSLSFKCKALPDRSMGGGLRSPLSSPTLPANMGGAGLAAAHSSEKALEYATSSFASENGKSGNNGISVAVAMAGGKDGPLPLVERPLVASSIGTTNIRANSGGLHIFPHATAKERAPPLSVPTDIYRGGGSLPTQSPASAVSNHSTTSTHTLSYDSPINPTPTSATALLSQSAQLHQLRHQQQQQQQLQQQQQQQQKEQLQLAQSAQPAIAPYNPAAYSRTSLQGAHAGVDRAASRSGGGPLTSSPVQVTFSTAGVGYAYINSTSNVSVPAGSPGSPGFGNGSSSFTGLGIVNNNVRSGSTSPAAVKIPAPPASPPPPSLPSLSKSPRQFDYGADYPGASSPDDLRWPGANSGSVPQTALQFQEPKRGWQQQQQGQRPQRESLRSRIHNSGSQESYNKSSTSAGITSEASMPFSSSTSSAGRRTSNQPIQTHPIQLMFPGPPPPKRK